MSFTPKSWYDLPLTTTPLDAAALADLETRLSAYTESRVGAGFPAVASATTIALAETASVFQITGTTNITSVTASWAGRRVTLVFVGILTFTDGSNLKLAGNLVTTGDDTITLVCDGTNWLECSRSVN